MEMDTQQLVLVFKLMQQVINPVKSVNRTVAGVGIFSLIRLRLNTGTGSAENVVLRDSIPNGTTFVAGSVTVGE